MKNRSCFLVITLLFSVFLARIALATSLENWKDKTRMSIAREGLTSCVKGDSLYLIGGYSSTYSDALEIYNFRENSWSQGKSLDFGIRNAASTVIGNEIYLLGGYNGDKGFLSTVFVYDIKEDRWSARKNMPEALDCFSILNRKGKLYLFGGFGEKGPSNKIYSYDIQSNIWALEGTLPDFLYGYSLISKGSKVYIVGGSNKFENFKDNWTDTLYIYDFENKIWEKGSKMPREMGLGSAVSKNNKIYVLGGRSNTLYSLDSFFMYDIEKNLWETMKILPENRFFPTAQIVNDSLYLIGGHNGKENLDTVISLELGEKGLGEVFYKIFCRGKK